MEDPKEVDDTLYIVDARPRQIGRMNVFREFVEQLEAQGKKVVVIDMPPSGLGGFRHMGVDSPRPPLLGAANALMGYRTDFHPPILPFPSLDHMFPMEESKDAMFDRFMTSMMTPSREWLDPIPDPTQGPIVKKEKNKLGFLDGLGYKKRKYGNQK